LSKQTIIVLSIPLLLSLLFLVPFNIWACWSLLKGPVNFWGVYLGWLALLFLIGSFAYVWYLFQEESSPVARRFRK